MPSPSPRLLLAVGFALGLPLIAPADDAPAGDGAIKVKLVFQGGHDTDPRDRGRPVTLVAAGLGVPAPVFREAFTHVHPAGPGQQPQDAQVRQNKQALMQRLAPYGVTDDRLNEVSNYYRYRRQNGEMWRHVDATGYALVRGGKIIGFTITNPGVGYTTPPVVSVPGVALTVYPLATLAFGTNLATNGSISNIVTTPLGDYGRIPRPASSSGTAAVPVEEETQGDSDQPPPPPPPPLPPPPPPQ
jgi:hypothetical protein